MSLNPKNLNIIILLTCQAKPFSPEFVDAIIHWLEISKCVIEQDVILNFSSINVITSDILHIDVIKKYDGVIVTGSYSSVNDNAVWMRNLCHVIRLCYAYEIPVFAICFGFQLLSYALGSTCSLCPHGFNYGAVKYRFTDEAYEYLKSHIEFCIRYKKKLDTSVNDDVEDCRVQFGPFSHKDIVDSLPNVHNIDYGDYSKLEIDYIREKIADLKFMNISYNECTPIVGLIIGNKSKYFMLAVQMHPEFDSPTGRHILDRILDLKIEDGVTTKELVADRLKNLNKSNTGNIYGRMALSLFLNKSI